ncbi:MAG: N-acetyltransferase family protein [Phycisphaerales bacterium]
MSESPADVPTDGTSGGTSGGPSGAPADPVIRTAVPADVPELLRLIAAHAEFERAPFDATGKAAGLERLAFPPAGPPRLNILVVDMDGGTPAALGGYASWTLEASTWDACLFAHMDCLFLDGDHRSAGIGRRLMATLARDATAAGVELVQWQTPSFNERAMRFYERLGTTRREKVRFYLDADAIAVLAAEAS